LVVRAFPFRGEHDPAPALVVMGIAIPRKVPTFTANGSRYPIAFAAFFRTTTTRA